MNARPKLTLVLSTTDKVIECLGWLALIGIWVLTLFNYSTLPKTIPIHFDKFGEADNFGKKWTILILPIVATVLFLGMTVLNQYPHSFNYIKTITEANAHEQYRNATRLIRFLKLVITVVFGLIVFQTIDTVDGNSKGLGIWFLPLTLGLIFIPIIYYLIKFRETRKDKPNEQKI